MPTETITLGADTIDGAAEQIIRLLESAENRRDVIYFHGWWVGSGASAILKAVVRKLRSSTGTARDMGKIIHVDCSQWQSKRALQKAIAEELELPPQVMALFDQHDEEDDFDGVEQSAREVIPYVKVAIMNELIARRFLVVLHNGSGSYIDLWEVGVPVMGQLSKRVLWTSRGRFWHHAQDGHAEGLQLVKLESATKWSDAAIFVFPTQQSDDVTETQVFRHALYAEAEEVAKYTGVPEPDMSPKIVIECILYMAMSANVNINWKSHASNYWVCDGIIQDGIIDGGGPAWEISDALQRNMSLDLCSSCIWKIWNVLSAERQRFTNRWVSFTNRSLLKEVQLTSQATSFFWTGGARLGLEACLLEHSNRSSLRVIHLSHCAFSFSSPPFQSCSNLRFLLLDHCKDKDNAQDDDEENDNCHHHSHHSRENSGGAWFRNLWVLELSHTDWYWLLSKAMLDLMSDLRELNVKGVGNRSMSHLHRCSGAGSNNSRCNLLKLRVVAEAEPSKDDEHHGAGGDTIQQVSPSFPDLSSWHNLKTVALDGCGDLEIIGSDALPLSLEIFSLTGNDTTKIKSISFRGCAHLKSLLLRGLFCSLEELDMSGTAIKMLDLSAAQVEGLKRLFLLGCEKLHAILWSRKKEDRKFLEVLRIDTSSSTLAAWDRKDKSHKQEEATSSSSDSTSTTVVGSPAAGGRAALWVCGNNDRALTRLDWYISLRDPRIFASLLNLRYDKLSLVEISSATDHKGTTKQGGNSGSDRQQVRAAGSNLYYDDDDIISMIFGSNSSQSGGGASISNGEMRNMWIWPCPPIPETPDDWPRCYISIQDEKHAVQGTTTRQLPTSAITLPNFVNEDARTLHLHDSLSITSLPGPAPAIMHEF
ncbi:hypothetical protein BDA96_10G351200 [Sorghum bicolor]|uniref:NB-ARC domain-containing protein n=2 Tax=Sorghum bicolor TaxID=4558 RepID=A0A921U2H3_SORBI|nr:uncharacterized protein LOC110430908 [Sorghum bicolor]XP_021304788.1 uncharacterized protein LOC110430908 [Sorghum bicolor]KAG0516312.1 hypothetical protein BDA96_10G351200 [Sorghum bicolor]KAG0516313.1 hypothetical protein BDA96_10G351200 [Sorghum bicolor]KXG20941.1 hypothetical protein SORBI_3010G273400 [Sorghum bicolor]|eukprot:XP_021304787.1 uncharacterized protein LOC110430908 [Sorghum bicolor]